MKPASDCVTTVIGGHGFIGRHVAAKLAVKSLPVLVPDRDDPALFKAPLGRVIYCAGVTSDFRQRPFDTMRAHVSLLSRLLEEAQFESLVYLSSTRVYLGSAAGREEAPLTVNPLQPDQLFHLSKLAGESLCLHAGRPNVRIARLSNVCGDDYGSGNFLYSLIRDAVHHKHITLRTTLDSEKDYIGVDEAAELLIRISREGRYPLYNVASGVNRTNREITGWIQQVTGCGVTVASDAGSVRFPTLDTSRIREEFEYVPSDGEALIRAVIDRYTASEGPQG